MGGKSTTAAPAAEKAAGPDNNKRLAHLEESTAKLADALRASGVELVEGADPFDLAIANFAKQSAGATEGEIAAIARAEKAEEALAEANEDLGAAINEKNRLANEVASLKEVIANKGYKQPEPAAAEAEAEPEPEPRERPESARDFHDGIEPMKRADLAALVEEGADFEIAFSNGDYELVGLAPVAVPATDFAKREGKLAVSPAIFVRGGEYAERIHGVALLHDGAQVAYCAFPEPVSIEPGQERRFERSIAF